MSTRVSVPVARGGNFVVLVSAKKSRRWGYATPFDLVGTRRLVPAFGLLGNPDVGLATSCCLCKTPAFGFEDQSLQTRFLGTVVVVIVAQKYKPPCTEWLTTTVHGRGNGRLGCLMHLVFGCSVKASGSLPHFEHTPWPPFVVDVVELCYPAGRGADPVRGAPRGG
ncbi:hypothetical protein F511_13596 [Dorcoceras hygrometricum]|uniref:Uncharacterized protein n=1 Tax=Dorcoceras hygrometricum TaxID=472368 RepID=A0A2Z7AXM1_9LAMI|nr:hypothetical protein F511_13596 [Dorcoceras hygrometricum]